MPGAHATQLTRRERQIMDILYQLGEASAADVRDRLPDPPSYSAVRAMLSKLEGKGHVEHRDEGRRYIFSPVVSRQKARESAVSRLVHTFFDGSVGQAVINLIGRSPERLQPEELDQLAEIIADARRKES